MLIKTPPDVSIVIVNLNARAMLQGCLRSLRDNLAAASIEIILVDNGSHDGSVEAAREEWPGLTVLQMEQNIGYVPANNLGLRQANGRYVFFLNNDTLVAEGAIGELVRFLDSHPEAGAVSGRVLNADGSDQGCARSLPSLANAIFGRRSLMTRLCPRNPWSRRYMICWHHPGKEPFEVQILSSAALMMRAHEAKELNGMDEDFRLYWVDAELCARIRRRGGRIFCVPRARILHFEGLGGSTRTFRLRFRATVAFHTDAYHAYVKIHQLRLWHPRALAVGAALSCRAALLTVVQLLRPKRATSSKTNFGSPAQWQAALKGTSLD
jgi:N-acetylglucosaminyl-diphospho-decaprenol L-rhamnosyltransferase